MNDYSEETHKIKPYYRYWGKAKSELNKPSGSHYHLLPYHCLDVAAVGSLLFSPQTRLNLEISGFLDVDPKALCGLLGFCLSLHDLGKFASAFQGLYTDVEENLISSHCRKAYDSEHYRHDRMGLFFWHQIRKESFIRCFSHESLARTEQLRLTDTFNILMECVLGHHGQPIDTSSPSSIKPYTEDKNREAALEFFLDVFELFKPELPVSFAGDEIKRRLELVSWQFAGIAVLADWLGSDESFFPYCSTPMPLENYWLVACENAEKALAITELNHAIQVRPFQSIQHHYGFAPTPLQAWAETIAIDDSPQLFILEDVTGSGKTEAALALTHRLMQAGAARGFYFGLPTMATSNAMFSRVAKHYLHMLSSTNKAPSIVLAHGAREMNTLFQETVLHSDNPDSEYDSNDLTATAQCNHWLADSRKKSLLAPVGVGTIDQALLAVLPRRHQSLRLLGLNHKILIFDEVHAADEYMFELLESLLALHLQQGGSAILLTATLSKKQRTRLANIWLKHVTTGKSISLRETHFPLATRLSVNAENPVIEQALQSRDDVVRTVGICFVHSMIDCIGKIKQAVANNQCVVWIRNSVEDALHAYKQVSEALTAPKKCLLFHSRFILADRIQIETQVLEVFGKQSGFRDRAGSVLIATQVFQESLDADADIMISDICPIDDLIQRAGRLHRHTRDNQGKYTQGIADARPPPELIVHAPAWSESPNGDWLSQQFRNTQYVYRSPGRLWLGMRELRRLGGMTMPDNARQLIEAVYGDGAYNEIPEPLS